MNEQTSTSADQLQRLCEQQRVLIQELKRRHETERTDVLAIVRARMQLIRRQRDKATNVDERLAWLERADEDETILNELKRCFCEREAAP